jgi:hypothetical protein
VSEWLRFVGEIFRRLASSKHHAPPPCSRRPSVSAWRDDRCASPCGCRARGGPARTSRRPPARGESGAACMGADRPRCDAAPRARGSFALGGDRAAQPHRALQPHRSARRGGRHVGHCSKDPAGAVGLRHERGGRQRAWRGLQPARHAGAGAVDEGRAYRPAPRRAGWHAHPGQRGGGLVPTAGDACKPPRRGTCTPGGGHARGQRRRHDRRPTQKRA